MITDALFSDGTSTYLIPNEPNNDEMVTFRFRTAKDDVSAVFLLSGDTRIVMQKVATRGHFDYYACEYKMSHMMFFYEFEIVSGNDKVYFNKAGVSNERILDYSFRIMPGFSVPSWSKGAVMYQIFVDRFNNGDKSNDVCTNEYTYIGTPVEAVEDWNELPQGMDVHRFYGGDLKGVRDKLDYLQDLGVEVIYFNPLFVSPSNHKYDIQDYDYIDPHFAVIKNSADDDYDDKSTSFENLEASNALFVELVEEMHKRGMKVILDGVFNHCGSFNKWLDKDCIYEGKEGYKVGAYISKESPYYSYFKFNNTNEEDWPYNNSYVGWWGHDTLPKLQYETSRDLYFDIMRIARKWVSPPFNVDGWRLDVAADLGNSNDFNHKFWEDFRKAVKDANPEAIILAEHYGNPVDWLMGDEWDTVMNYDAFMEPITWFLTGMEKHSDEYRDDLYGNFDYFLGAMRHHMAQMMTPSLQCAMNELSNHDHSRFLTRTNRTVGRIASKGSKAAEEGIDYSVMKLAITMQMTWVGSPTIYYGDEVGVCGFTDPDSRRTFPWGNENKDLHDFYKESIRIHKEHDVLKTGSIMCLFGSRHILSFARFNREEQVIVVINNQNGFEEITIPVWKAGVDDDCKLKRLLYSYKDGYTTEEETYLNYKGKVVVNMGPKSSLILIAKGEN